MYSSSRSNGHLFLAVRLKATGKFLTNAVVLLYILKNSLTNTSYFPKKLPCNISGSYTRCH
jgi:hypothetical protein